MTKHERDKDVGEQRPNRPKHAEQAPPPKSDAATIERRLEETKGQDREGVSRVPPVKESHERPK